MGLLLIKTFHNKAQPMCTRIYLVQVHQNFISYLTSTHSLQLHVFIFWNILEVHTKLNLSFFFKFNKEEKNFLPKPNQMRKLRDEWMIWINQFSFSFLFFLFSFLRKSNWKTILKSMWKRIFSKTRHSPTIRLPFLN